MQDQILIVDDHPPICKSLSEVLNRAGYKAHTANNGFEALEAINQEQFSVVVTDMDMPKMDGLEVLQRTKAIVPDTAVVIITGYASVDSAVKAMKYGAYDYITKPVTTDKIKAVIQNAITRAPVEAMKIREMTGVGTSPLEPQIITSDPQMMEVLDMVRLIAQTDSTVLIQGESGTGKELIARAIHGYSLRTGQPFVAVNCAALPEGLIESELFGHEKGAFTGAIARRTGKLELAHGGTILLDEVSEMARPFQAKLLRAIQEREVVRVGGGHPFKVDVRIIATTNKNLSEEVDNGNFREDLFYRLRVVPIFLPPLRERADDIPLLVQSFVQCFCARMGKKSKTISQKAMELLKSYPWHGNVRELENTIEGAVALTQKDIISPGDLFFTDRRRPSDYISLKIGTSLHDIEQEFILRTLEKSDGNKQKTADILGITSKTIRNKLRQYGYDELSQPEDTEEC
jgi:DNA-binding NtrC family response regulator